MEIVRKEAGGWIELHVKGRLDSYWSNDLKKTFTELIHQGSHHLRVNLSEVTYLSSAGLGVLIACFKQLQEIRGKLAIVNASEAVKEVFAVTKIDLLLARTEARARGSDQNAGRTAMYYERGTMTLGVFPVAGGTALQCKLIGDPGLLRGGRFAESNCQKISLSPATLAVGVGAL